MISPEEVLTMSLQPTMAALNNAAAGRTDFAKLQYLNALKEKEAREDFARRAQEARELLALRGEMEKGQLDSRLKSDKEIADARIKAESVLQLKRDELQNDREDARQKAMDLRAEKAQQAMLDRMTTQQKEETIQKLTLELGGELPEFPDNATYDDKIRALSKKLSDVVGQGLSGYDKRIEGLRKEAQKAAGKRVTNEMVEAEFIKQAVAAKVGATTDNEGNLQFLDATKAQKLMADYAARRAVQGPNVAATEVFGLSANSIREAVKNSLIEGVTESLMRQPQYARPLLELTEGRNRLHAKSPAANLAKLADTILPPGAEDGLPPGAGADGGSSGAPISREDAIRAIIQRDNQPASGRFMPGALVSDVALGKIQVAMQAAPTALTGQAVVAPPTPQPEALSRTAFGGPPITSGEFWNNLVPSWSAFKPQPTNAVPAAIVPQPPRIPIPVMRPAPMPTGVPVDYRSFFAPTVADPTALILEEYRRRAALDPMRTFMVPTPPLNVPNTNMWGGF